MPATRGKLFTLELRADARTKRALFKNGDWNRMERTALITAGSQWIGRHLVERFGPKASAELGYDAKKLARDRFGADTQRRRLRIALGNGTIDKLAATWTRGWNPWINPFAPDAQLKAYIAYMQRTEHRFLKTRTGEWKIARKELRTITKKILLTKLLEMPAGDLDTVMPLVETGKLRSDALSNARADAVATANKSSMKIVIPQPHPTAEVVGRTLRVVTPAELAEMSEFYGQTFEGLLLGAETYQTKRGANAGKTLMRLTKDQRETADLFTQARSSAPVNARRSAAAKAAHAARRQRAAPGGAQRAVPA